MAGLIWTDLLKVVVICVKWSATWMLLQECSLTLARDTFGACISRSLGGKEKGRPVHSEHTQSNSRLDSRKTQYDEVTALADGDEESAASDVASDNNHNNAI
jgi:hypothetical protein